MRTASSRPENMPELPQGSKQSHQRMIDPWSPDPWSPDLWSPDLWSSGHLAAKKSFCQTAFGPNLDGRLSFNVRDFRIGFRNSVTAKRDATTTARTIRSFSVLCLPWHWQDAGSWKVGAFKPIQLTPTAVEYRQVVHRRSSCSEFPWAESQKPWKLVATNPTAGV